MTPDLPPPELPRFAKEPSAMGIGRPLSVSLAVCLAWAVVAIGLLGQAYYFFSYTLRFSQSMSQVMIWWYIYAWVKWCIIIPAGFGVWARNGLSRWALTVVLGVDIAVHAWGLANMIKSIAAAPDVFFNPEFLTSFALFNVLGLVL